jgi:hypothetical protein
MGDSGRSALLGFGAKRACPACGENVLTPIRIVFVGRCPTCGSGVDFSRNTVSWAIASTLLIVAVMLTHGIVGRPLRFLGFLSILFLIQYLGAAARSTRRKACATPLGDDARTRSHRTRHRHRTARDACGLHLVAARLVR